MNVGRRSTVSAVPQQLKKLYPTDNVYVCLQSVGDEYVQGFKYAASKLSSGELIIKLGRPIGIATTDIDMLAEVHLHNIAELPEKDSEPEGVLTTGFEEHRYSGSNTLSLFENPFGGLATRKCILVIANVSCVNDIVKEVAHRYSGWRGPQDTHVIPLVHGSGCGHVSDGVDLKTLRSTIEGYINNPNCFGAILVTLGCEDQSDFEFGRQKTVVRHSVQEGSSRAVLIDSIASDLEGMVSKCDQIRRIPGGLSDLVVGLQCGGSDGLSAVTANPLVGLASDLLVNAGATTVLAETPETLGAQRELLSRCVNAGDQEKLSKIFEAWERRGTAYKNPAPGNFAGGISTAREKSAGSVLKGGRREIQQVLAYAEALSVSSGLVFMDSPGYDPCSITGQISAGANIIVFTTGRGSSYRNSFVPVVKVSSNSAIATNLLDVINVDAQEAILNNGASGAAQLLIENIIKCASGLEDYEFNSFVHSDFVPWLSEGAN